MSPRHESKSERQACPPAFAKMSSTVAACVLLHLFLGAEGAAHLRRDASNPVSDLGNAATGTLSAGAQALPAKVPELPIGVAGTNYYIPVVGTYTPHTADPAVCGILGGVIVLNWIIACCFAGAGAAAAEEAAGKTAASEGAGAASGAAVSIFACVECTASIFSIIALVYSCYTGLWQALLGGQAVSGWCLALAIISILQVLACVCICCCATCGSAILGPVAYEKYVNQHSKHVFGSHMHEMVHKHKPGGTHSITEGHLPMVGHISDFTGKKKEDEAPAVSQ